MIEKKRGGQELIVGGGVRQVDVVTLHEDMSQRVKTKMEGNDQGPDFDDMSSFFPC